MGEVMRDVRYALRQMMKNPGFAGTAVLTLALGIGANAAIFTLVHAVLLQALPVEAPEQLMRVGDTDDCCVNGGFPENNDYSIFAYDMYLYLRDHTPEFENLAGMRAGGGMGSVTARREGSGSPAAPASGEFVSGNYFQTFRSKPAAGRLMLPADDAPEAPLVAVMGYETWQREFGRDPSVVGSTFVINAHPFTIVGVAPAGFYGDRLGTPVGYYLPFNAEPVLEVGALLHNKTSNWVYLLGRVKPGTDVKLLQAKLSAEVRDWLGANVEPYATVDGKAQLGKTHVVLTPGATGIGIAQIQLGAGLKLLMTIAGLVLLIACANIANLVLVRGLARRAEVSVRMALGAGRGRLIRQMLTESVVLAVLGGVAGIAVAYAGVKALLAMAFTKMDAMPIDAAPSPVVLVFAFGVSLLTGVVFGLAPAWITSHGEPAEALRGSGRSTARGASLLQRSLVVVQAALSLVLLVMAGLATRSLNKLQHQDFGLTTEHRLVVHLSPEDAGFSPEALPALYPQMLERLGALPGVQRVGLALYTPLEGNNWGEGVRIAGQPEPGPRENNGASWDRVSPDYFRVIGQRVVRGRGITEQDTATSRGVTVVNEAFVRKFFKHGEDPIGQHFGVNGPKGTNDFEIVGVASDVRYNNVREPIRAMYMRPLLQVAASGVSDPKMLVFERRSLYINSAMLEMRGPVEGMEARVRGALASINPNLTVVNFETFEEQIGQQFVQERMIARLCLLFGVLALALAAIGLYGVTAYTVARRTSEIGIRMALGAERGSVVRMVLRDALLQTLVGLAVGIPVALLCGRYVKTQLYGVSGHDLGVMAQATVALALAALVAGLIPAVRAAGTDPVKALRSE